MNSRIEKFLRSEDGAVTVDWVVLTAAIVGLGVAVITVIGNGAMDKSSGVAMRISSITPGSI